MNSYTPSLGPAIFCCCNIYNLAKFLNGVEISLIIFGNILSTTNPKHGHPQWYQYLIFGMVLVYLILECHGILQMNLRYIIFGCVMRMLRLFIMTVLLILLLVFSEHLKSNLNNMNMAEKNYSFHFRYVKLQKNTI